MKHARNKGRANAANFGRLAERTHKFNLPSLQIMRGGRRL